MSDELEAADVLDEAHDILLVTGRCTGYGQNDAGELCVRGAVLAAQGKNPASVFGIVGGPIESFERWLYAQPDLLSRDLVASLGDGPSMRSGRVPSWAWNDDPDTTDDDVFDALRRCAKSLREAAQS